MKGKGNKQDKTEKESGQRSEARESSKVYRK